jgi:glycosyltransferase involved in cell wall biosynthesis
MQNHSKQSWNTSIHIVINKKPSDFNKFKCKIKYIKARYEASIILCFTEAAHLFLNKNMYRLATEGGFDKGFCTSKPNTIAIDLIEFAKRQDSDKYIFLSLDQLENNFKESLKFITRNLYSEKSIISTSQVIEGHLTQLTKTDLLDLQGNLTGKLQSKQHQNTLDLNLENGNLFSTNLAIERLGGFENIENNNITFGGALISKYKAIWLIDNDTTAQNYLDQFPSKEKNGRVIKIPGTLANLGTHKLLTDINPIECNTNNNYLINFSRTILTIQPFTHTLAEEYNGEFHFITSNYNKNKYVCNAIYSMLLQTYEKINIHILDDQSTDNSLETINQLTSIIDKSKIKINPTPAKTKLGTYGIRNEIIKNLTNEKEIYAINDSDDFSCAQRAYIQINRLNAQLYHRSICFGDIIRVNENFGIIAMDGEVERYGTASMATKVVIHKKLGFYEFVKKNADTEFISRVKQFIGTKSIDWFRYPTLFQPFDGNNLTADIYASNGGELNQNLNHRATHKKLFERHHASLNINDLPHYYLPDKLPHTKEYENEIPEFIVTQ